MDIVKRLDLINSKNDFVEFMYTLKKDKIDNANEWESKDIDWKFIATLFYVGKIYE